MKDKLITKNYIEILAANFLLFFGFWLLMPVLPFYLAEVFDANKTTIGAVLSCYTIAALCIRPFSGYLLDTFARKPLYLLAYFTFTAIFGGYLVLADKGFISLDVEYIDGTKIESKANKYTFVWRKSVEKHRTKLLDKIRILLEQVDEAIAQENSVKDTPAQFTPAMLSDIVDELKEVLEHQPATKDKEQKKALRKKKKQLKELEGYRDKLMEYDNHLEVLGERNSYSKTDPDATFMRMKEDAMKNGQTKPGYNLQIGTEKQFLIDFRLFPNPTDTLTLIPFFHSFQHRYNRLPAVGVADSGYGSEENYRFMQENGIEAFVKYNFFHKEQRPRYTPNPFHAESLHYNTEEDYYVCPMGQRMNRIGTRRDKTASGYITESARYKAQNCEGCPLRGSCFKAQGNRIIEVNHRLNQYKRQAREKLLSEERYQA